MAKKIATIVLPTYNEKENIKITLDRLIHEFKNIADYDMQIIVVDDNSPDRTWEVVKQYALKHKNIHLMLRKKKSGLGSAYIEGMSFALKNFNSDFIFNMDADLSHDPKLIKQMLYFADDGFDLVIGSRYIQGGGYPDWPLYRIILSKGANNLAKFILGIKVNDISSGFRCYKQQILRAIDLSTISCTGYAFLEEILYSCIRHGAKIKEIPLIFQDRISGETKLSKREILRFFITIIKLRIKYGKA